MNLQEFFAISGSSYEEIHNRISSDILLKKFLRQFLEDKTFENLVEAVDKKAFFASHSLKGICSNLGLAKLEKDTIVLLEYLRANSENPDIDETFCNDSFAKIKQDYEQVISSIKILED